MNAYHFHAVFHGPKPGAEQHTDGFFKTDADMSDDDSYLAVKRYIGKQFQPPRAPQEFVLVSFSLIQSGKHQVTDQSEPGHEPE